MEANDIPKETEEILQGVVNEGKETGEAWLEPPVSPQEFFEKYIGEAAYPEQQSFVDKTLGTNPTTWDSTFQEGIGLIGKGGGKDRTISKILVYCVYKLLCMRNPQKYLREMGATLGVGSAIDLGNVSINSRLAKDVFFKNFTTLLRETRDPKTGKNWFEEHGVDLQKAIQIREVKFPKNITAYSLDSEEYTGEGLNLLVVIFDEVGGFPPLKAKKLYSALKTTQRSRFPKLHKTFLISYPRDENDYMMIRYNEAKNEPTTFRDRKATWEWNPRVTMEDFADDFAKDPIAAKRTYQCIIEAGERGYIRYRERISASFNKGRDNPVFGDRVWTDDLLTLRFKESFIPLIGISYYCHVDLAKGQEGGDCAGISIGHLVRGMTTTLSQEYVENVLKNEGIDLSRVAGKPQVGVVIDLAIQIRARPGQEIQLEEVRLFLEKLKYGAKFPIHKVTYDGWQSLGEIQLLNKAGIQSEVQSVDRDRIAYDSLKELIYKGLVDLYAQPILQRELEELQLTEVGQKVDHPDNSYRRQVEEGRMGGSKDVADAVAGVVRLCLEAGQYEFRSWAANRTPGVPPKSVDPQREEQEKLVRYGEKPHRRMNW